MLSLRHWNETLFVEIACSYRKHLCLAHFLELIIHLFCWEFCFTFIKTTKSWYWNMSYWVSMSDNDNAPWCFYIARKKILYFLVNLILLILFCLPLAYLEEHIWIWLHTNSLYTFDLRTFFLDEKFHKQLTDHFCSLNPF